jgi:hypothetical protein
LRRNDVTSYLETFYDVTSVEVICFSFVFSVVKYVSNEYGRRF